MEWWLWVIFGLGLLVVEMVTPGGLFALFFGVGALVVGALTGLGVSGPAWLQWLVFAAISLAALALLRRRVRAGLFGHVPRVDSLIGETAVPLEDLPPHATGKAELRGSSWSARNAGDAPLARGQRCRVERVEGLTLWIRPE